jgi:hypothetical protein
LAFLLMVVLKITVELVGALFDHERCKPPVRLTSVQVLPRMSASSAGIRRTGRLGRLQLGGRHCLVRLARVTALRLRWSKGAAGKAGAACGGEYQAGSGCGEDKPDNVGGG